MRNKRRMFTWNQSITSSTGLRSEPHGSSKIDAHSVREFLREHLPACQCQHPAPRHVKTVRAALNQLLLMLGQDRIHASDSPASAAIEASLLQFDAYLRDVCGLAPITRHNRCRYVKQFLTHLFGDQALVYECIDAGNLINFITQQGRHYQPGTLGAVAGALRSYLRFLQFTGGDAGHYSHGHTFPCKLAPGHAPTLHERG